MAGGPFPAKVAGLFDSLIDKLIDGTEQATRNPEALNSVVTVESGTSTFDHSTLRQPVPCTRPLSLKPSTVRRGYDFENNRFRSPSDGASTKTRSIVDFENFESEESVSALDKMLQSRGKVTNTGSHTTDGYENSSIGSSFVQVRCCDAPHSPKRATAGFDNPLICYDSDITEERATIQTKRLAGDRDGYEVTFNTVDHEGNPFEIRAVCPEFVPRRVWLNGKPFDYIDEESDVPILSQACNCESDCSNATTIPDSESTWT